LAASEDPPVRAADNLAGMAHHVEKRLRQNVDRVAGPAERRHEIWIESVLDTEAELAPPPGGSEQEAWRLDRIAEGFAEAVAGEDLGDVLRLALAAHRAER